MCYVSYWNWWIFRTQFEAIFIKINESFYLIFFYILGGWVCCENKDIQRNAMNETKINVKTKMYAFFRMWAELKNEPMKFKNERIRTILLNCTKYGGIFVLSYINFLFLMAKSFEHVRHQINEKNTIWKKNEQTN